MDRFMTGVLVGCFAWLTAGCQPLTYSHDGVVNFDRYRKVFVEVSGESQWFTDYLAAELWERSGFESVTTRVDASVDAFLSVSLETTTGTTTDSDGNTIPNYTSVATYVAHGANERVLCSGEEEDTNTSYEESVEDALDEIALVFRAPYRI
jgi:hypothetical protein